MIMSRKLPIYGPAWPHGGAWFRTANWQFAARSQDRCY